LCLWSPRRASIRLCTARPCDGQTDKPVGDETCSLLSLIPIFTSDVNYFLYVGGKSYVGKTIIRNTGLQSAGIFVRHSATLHVADELWKKSATSRVVSLECETTFSGVSELLGLNQQSIKAVLCVCHRGCHGQKLSFFRLNLSTFSVSRMVLIFEDLLHILPFAKQRRRLVANYVKIC